MVCRGFRLDAGDLLDAIDQHLENLDDSTRLGYISLHVQEELLNRALDDIKSMTLTLTRLSRLSAGHTVLST